MTYAEIYEANAALEVYEKQLKEDLKKSKKTNKSK